MRVHPSDKSKTPYSFDGFVEFANGDQAKAQRMWNESSPSVPAAAEKKEELRRRREELEKKKEELEKKKEEMRIHPSDKGKTPYTYSGFLEFCNGDTTKAQRMWNESKPAATNGGGGEQKAWQDHSKPSKTESSWWENGQASSQASATSRSQNWSEEFIKPASKAASAKRPNAASSLTGVGAAADAKRARTEGTAQKGASKAKAASAEDKLPPGWTKEWSDEYGIPFYWHADTEQSSWEKPT